MSESPASPSQEDVIAKPGKFYRNARYIVVAMALLAGLWFAYDGFINWPAQKRAWELLSPEEQAKGRLPHTDLDIDLNKRLAMLLIPMAPVLLAIFIYRSRGSYRLSGTTLYVPGHPPVPFECIVGLDKSKWERKGIAYVDYELPGEDGVSRLTLDDFVYEQAATDLIVERIEAYLPQPTEEAGEPENSQEAAGDTPDEGKQQT